MRQQILKKLADDSMNWSVDVLLQYVYDRYYTELDRMTDEELMTEYERHLKEKLRKANRG